MAGNCNTCYLNRFTLIRTTDGKEVKPHCKSYTCQEYGWQRKKDLEKALSKYMQDWKHIRFWTFTLSSKLNLSKEEHYRKLSETWRYFITYLRRSKLLTAIERDVQYVKVGEPHKSGYYHFHAVFDRYIRWEKIQAIWIACGQHVTGFEQKVSHCYVKGVGNKYSASKYIAKYVVKCAHERRFRIRSWSKSSRVALFEKKAPNLDWVLLPKGRDWAGYFIEPPPLLEYSNNKITDSNDNIAPNLGSVFDELENLALEYKFLKTSLERVQKRFIKKPKKSK